MATNRYGTTRRVRPEVACGPPSACRPALDSALRTCKSRWLSSGSSSKSEADMGRRAKGDGSVFYDAARARWVGVVDVGRDPQTGRRRRRKVSAPTKSEAREKLDELRDEQRRTGTVA